MINLLSTPMGSDHSIRAAFFLLMIITGVLTSMTDLRHKKIRNDHLIIIAIAAVILTIAQGVLDKSLAMLQLCSTGCAIMIAWVFYKNDLWRGGDAKLFILYSFLMPVTGYESRIFFPCLALFVNAFITGLIFIGILFVKNFFINPKLLLPKNFFNEYLEPSHVINMTSMTLYISWITFPLFIACGLTRHGIVYFLSIYMINICLGKCIGMLVYYKAFAVIAFVCGLLLRYKFSPEFFLWKNVLLYLSTVIIYSVFSILLLQETKDINKSSERVPFAPFFFLGCLLSYTPLMNWVMSL